VSHPGDLLSAYLDGELTADEHVAVAAHLDACEACRSEFAATASARASLRSLPQIEPPPALFLVDRDSPAEVRFLRPVWRWAAAGIAALALAVGLVLGPGTRPPPMDLDTLAERHTARVVVQPGFTTVRAVLESP